MATPPNSPDSPIPVAVQSEERVSSGENLALLYQSLLTGIIRLKSQRQQISDTETFRKRTMATLQEVERVAVGNGYDLRDVRDTHFAVVAFLDSAVLHSKDPVRAAWERKPLQEELFGQTDAGVIFFEKLDQLRARRDSERLADVLEVYLLCLLLGFQGRYSGGKKGELEAITDSVRMRIEYIRGRQEYLSPSAILPQMPATVAAPRPQREHLRVLAVAIIALTMLTFLVLKLNLISRSNEIRNLF